MNRIKRDAINEAIDGIREMLFSYLGTINKAYLAQDELKISAGMKFQPTKSGVSVTYNISFVESRVKDGDTIFIDDKQIPIPFKRAEL
jgi:hypothetical protein